MLRRQPTAGNQRHRTGRVPVPEPPDLPAGRDADPEAGEVGRVEQHLGRGGALVGPSHQTVAQLGWPKGFGSWPMSLLGGTHEGPLRVGKRSHARPWRARLAQARPFPASKERARRTLGRSSEHIANREGTRGTPERSSWATTWALSAAQLRDGGRRQTVGIGWVRSSSVRQGHTNDERGPVVGVAGKHAEKCGRG